jgi:hypothetical protein
MLGEADDYMHKEKEKFRALKELYKNLQVSFEELKTSHNNLKESCESLVESQNSPLVHEVMVVTKDVGITCDLLDSSTSDSQPTSFICDKCKISLENDDIGCDESNIIIENEALVRRVNALTHDLEKKYGGKAKLDFAPVCFSFLELLAPKAATSCQTLSFSVSFYKIRLGKNHSKST